uniref:Transmembrane protein 120B n=1 Tax=Sus scrofa TaxID=9823 RepID=A0A4X1U8B6_PIG
MNAACGQDTHTRPRTRPERFWRRRSIPKGVAAECAKSCKATAIARQARGVRGRSRRRCVRMPGACLPERGWGGSRGGGCDVRCARGSGCAGTAGASEGGRRADWREVLVARRATLREPPPPPRTAAPCPASWSVASASGMSWRENFRNCRYKRHASQEEAELVQQLGANIKERQNVFFDMEAYLPKKNGLYLNLVLGNVNVTLLSKQAKFAYKDEYEKFKLYLTIILLLGAVACRFVLHYRVTDEIFNFLLVWYYCTLTIRESILISNGSRIKGWWVSHHYVSTFLSGVMLTWPNGLIYQKFRNQFLAFSIFQSCVQFLQYYYQRGCLYRLRALGERNHLDLTVEGFQSWMWRGLTFLLPFLFCGHVFVLALTFLILFLGNFLTTLKVVHTKLQENRSKAKKP